MTKWVTVVDYGTGNIFSVTRALEQCGATVVLTDRPLNILDAERLVLPGVGAFANGMQGLKERLLIAPLQEYAACGRPLLGICLGMQMLFSESVEFGAHRGLGIIDGKIVAIEPRDEQDKSLKVPHIGWGRLERPARRPSWRESILDGLDDDQYGYFVHSFTAVPDDDADRLADTMYGKTRISAAVAKGKVYGCQFHPEKSGPVGLRIMKNFLEI